MTLHFAILRYINTVHNIMYIYTESCMIIFCYNTAIIYYAKTIMLIVNMFQHTLTDEVLAV